MRTFVTLLAASALSTPALAQHQGHGEPPPAEVSCTPEHAAMGHCTMPDEGEAADPHSGHQMPAQEPDPHAGHEMPAQEPDAHAGHQMPDPSAPEGGGPHFGGHVMAPAATPPDAPPPPEAFAGPEHAADLYYGDAAMVRARSALLREHGALPAYRIFFDRVEARFGEGPDAYLVEGQAWYGGDIDKLWLKAEIEGEWEHGLEEAEVQALWSHAIDPWFDVQAGVRYDARRGPDRGHLVLGVQGLAPYWWEVEGTLFLSDKGDVTARAEAEYDLRITQKLILQPRIEVDLSAQDIPELGIGAGVSEASAGARLRYEVSKLFAPYVGVEYRRAFGDTRRFRRADGEGGGGWNLLTGIRFWF